MAKTTGDTCTFCGRSSRDVNLLINGISGCICDDCARQAYEIVKEQTGGKKTSFGLKQKAAARIFSRLRMIPESACRAVNFSSL